ncbi:acyclic terpene utilization AtuA family protein [Pseudoteredinibacter isoporae]|uniref:DUF1446 domain-containing protein n=1 Tax=Pseudoteredinibacter isoporae TaxID=570281 RepID=A0A7X0MX97_9GAMM|nr:acyclic terpene utilization AtuA family protein [Pseudoteredinibacter isoporae]MBB6521824.1 hypothetical protein [Pseudoteredinibacter isoporae]NHO87369.1 DUF1446 domain-containing protein [Pseudoteredinibacter isoporae]NIB23193.1 DUF1446 domain-containing protein [Pseudoteredinibacter isoporae]
MKKDSIRIANCSGFMGDRFSAAQEMVNGGPIDALTGDYLAEITMGGLKSFQELSDSPEDSGYAANFLFQAQQVLAECLEKKIKIVVNAGGINPAGLASALEKMANNLGLQPKVAWIDGDNLLPRLSELQAQGEALSNMETGDALASCDREIKTANAYLGGWGIKTALDAGADVVIAPRTTDAALVLGLGAWKFQWQRDDYDALAGAIVAGHIIECGPQACGGNYSFFDEMERDLHIGFPIAELFADGSSEIYKHEGTDGLVSVGTVTEQILYESQTTEYFNPDVVSHFDSIVLEQLSNDRVKVSQVKGSAPSSSHKVCINTFGGYKTMMTVPLAGAKAELKADYVYRQWLHFAGGEEQFDSISRELIQAPYRDAQSQEESFSYLRLVAYAKDRETLELNFKAKEFELVLASIPGYVPSLSHGLSSNVLSYMVHWPALVSSKYITEHVYVNGECIEVKPIVHKQVESEKRTSLKESDAEQAALTSPAEPLNKVKLLEVELGEVFGTRSGDKGGLANVGVWARDDKAFEYLKEYLTVSRLQELLPDTQGLNIERHEFTGVRALNFCLHRYLKNGADSSGRLDGLAKALGQYLAGKCIVVPESLL